MTKTPLPPQSPLHSVTSHDCRVCGQKCCRSISFEVETPGCREDFEQLRWMISHRGVFVYIEKGEWYVEVATDCDMLAADGSCRIYDTRPAICRDHGIEMETETLCEGLQDVIATYERYFTSLDELEEYIPGYLAGVEKKQSLLRRLRAFFRARR